MEPFQENILIIFNPIWTQNEAFWTINIFYIIFSRPLSTFTIQLLLPYCVLMFYLHYFYNFFLLII